MILRVDPAYPPLARQMHGEGVVTSEAVLDEQGHVVEAKVTSGRALLIQAALDAVRRWRNEPRKLNDEAVPVQLSVRVTIRLKQ